VLPYQVTSTSLRCRAKSWIVRSALVLTVPLERMGNGQQPSWGFPTGGSCGYSPVMRRLRPIELGFTILLFLVLAPWGYWIMRGFMALFG
jgi:hypothetical protein